MPFLANDRLDPARTPRRPAADDRELPTRTSTCSRCASSCGPPAATLALDWMLDGYNRRTEAEPGEAPGRAT